MKTITDKQKRTIIIVSVGIILLLIISGIFCGIILSGHEPDESDTDPSSETMTNHPEEGSESLSSEEESSKPATEGDPVESDPKGEQDSDPSQDTQTPPAEETTERGEDTSEENPSAAPSPTYEEYSAMTSQEQVDFYNSFPDIEGFFLWFEAAKADYEERHPGIEIGPGDVIIP